jgi:glycerophosphoryl diester phosphodiesterase
MGCKEAGRMSFLTQKEGGNLRTGRLRLLRFVGFGLLILGGGMAFFNSFFQELKMISRPFRWHFASMWFTYVQGYKTTLAKDQRTNLRVLPKLIAHAGGAIDNVFVPNCLEALEHNYNIGFRAFELDIEWTSDHELVVLHDWDVNISGIQKERMCSLKEFLARKRSDGRTQLTFADLAEWLRKRSDSILITDVKRWNVAALQKIRSLYPDLIARIIPQIFRFYEFKQVQQLGYKHIIFTNYGAGYPDALLFDFLSRADLTALTMPDGQVSSALTRHVKALGIPLYVHTINDPLYESKNPDVFGVYTDFLKP